MRDEAKRDICGIMGYFFTLAVFTSIFSYSIGAIHESITIFIMLFFWAIFGILWTHYNKKLKNRRSCMDCDDLKINYYLNTQEIKNKKVYYGGRGEAYCNRMMKRIGKYNNKTGISLETPSWCPKRREKK